MWGTFAEFLASHGYIVAAPTFVSDGTLPLVFHDEGAAFRNEREWSEVAAAHEELANEAKVVTYFHRLLFDGEAAPAKRKAVPGGVERATTMMRNLFRQRLGHVALMLRTVLSMGMDEPACRTALASMGATSAARPTSNSYLCDLLNGRIDADNIGGRIDADNIGAAGHSLGSMTAQLAANHLPAVDAAFGLNNAPPFKWTPEEMLGGSEGGVRKPLLLMVGDEDAFVQSIFIGLFTAAVRAAGGDAKQAFPLAAERAAPDRMTNPQPVALSGWQRARSDRFLVIVRDVGHDTLVNEAARLFPWPALRARRTAFRARPRPHPQGHRRGRLRAEAAGRRTLRRAGLDGVRRRPASLPAPRRARLVRARLVRLAPQGRRERPRPVGRRGPVRYAHSCAEGDAMRRSASARPGT